MTTSVSLPKLVVFCGAGFSVSAGLPTMLTFSYAVQTSAFLSDIDKSDFNKIQIACSALTAMTGTSSRNLEDIGSLLSVLALSRPSFQFSDCERSRTPDQALQLLNRCIRAVFAPESHRSNCNANQLFSQLGKNCDLTVVTTNYDLNIEIAAVHHKRVIRTSSRVRSGCLWGTQAPTPSTCSLYTPSLDKNNPQQPMMFDLFKLHGSVNWYQVNGGLVVDDVVRISELNPPSDGVTYSFGMDGSERLDPDMRRLVPPTVIKADGLSDLSAEWEGASNAMAQADAIWFIGYSFPETDTFMRYFLAGALHGNTRVRQIAILDPDAGSIVARSTDLFGSAELRDLVVALPMRWEPFSQHFASLLSRTWKPSIDDHGIKAMRAELEGRAVLQGAVVPSREPENRLVRGRGLSTRWIR